MAKPFVIFVNEDEEVVLNKERLREIIEESYQQGYIDGRGTSYQSSGYTGFRDITTMDIAPNITQTTLPITPKLH